MLQNRREKAARDKAAEQQRQAEEAAGRIQKERAAKEAATKEALEASERAARAKKEQAGEEDKLKARQARDAKRLKNQRDRETDQEQRDQAAAAKAVGGKKAASEKATDSYKARRKKDLEAAYEESAKKGRYEGLKPGGGSKFELSTPAYSPHGSPVGVTVTSLSPEELGGAGSPRAYKSDFAARLARRQEAEVAKAKSPLKDRPDLWGEEMWNTPKSSRSGEGSGHGDEPGGEEEEGVSAIGVDGVSGTLQDPRDPDAEPGDWA